MTARETYLDVIKEQHIRSVIDMCLDKYDIYQTNEQILNSVFELDVNPDAKIDFASSKAIVIACKAKYTACVILSCFDIIFSFVILWSVI